MLPSPPRPAHFSSDRAEVRHRPAARLGRSTVALAALVLALHSGCTDRSPPGEGGETGRLDVVCTTGMIADAARIVGGEQVQVSGLMQPGVDPHLYLASREDQRRLQRADLVLYHGLHLEGKMTEVLAKLEPGTESAPRKVAVAEAVPKEKLFRNEAFQDYPDPHVWFDLELWQLVVARITQALVERDPKHAEAYRARGAAYGRKLAEAHAWALAEIAKLPASRRRVVTSHDAYNYFGRAYGVEVRGLQGISTDTQAGQDEIKKAVAFIKEHGIPVVFAETSVPKNAIEQVSRQAGCTVCPHELYSDALGKRGTPEESFLGVFRHNVRTIVASLGSETGD